jgi:hypothetical protein
MRVQPDENQRSCGCLQHESSGRSASTVKARLGEIEVGSSDRHQIRLPAGQQLPMDAGRPSEHPVWIDWNLERIARAHSLFVLCEFA